MARMNELSVSVSPLENSPQLRSDEEFVQTMWVAVRYHYDTDMKPFMFSKLPGPEKLKWAIALRKFVRFPFYYCLRFRGFGFVFVFKWSLLTNSLQAFIKYCTHAFYD